MATTTTTALRETAAWRALEEHAEQVRRRHLRDLFAKDATRGERLTAEAEGLFLDYSKNRITDETLGLLLKLGEERGVAERRDAMFAGEHINVTEDRAVLHIALRAPNDQLVHDTTRFWNASGLQLSASASGFQVNTESLEALLAGGVAFDTRDKSTSDQAKR